MVASFYILSYTPGRGRIIVLSLCRSAAEHREREHQPGQCAHESLLARTIHRHSGAPAPLRGRTRNPEVRGTKPITSGFRVRAEDARPGMTMQGYGDRKHVVEG